jgi:hypothetical protein
MSYRQAQSLSGITEGVSRLSSPVGADYMYRVVFVPDMYTDVITCLLMVAETEARIRKPVLLQKRSGSIRRRRVFQRDKDGAVNQQTGFQASTRLQHLGTNTFGDSACWRHATRGSGNGVWTLNPVY